ncbi:MAG: hypothetical protein WAX04_12415 [Oscillospiraceae bacterium]
MQDYIYLVLSSSSSFPAKVIKFFSRNSLNHSSIAIDKSLKEMYSFGRLVLWNPFHGGFVKEDKDKGFYIKFTDTYINMYRFPVSKETYNETKEYLETAYNNKKAFKYNFMGVVLGVFNIPICRENQYFCSEFVAKVFQDCSIREIPRDVHTYRPYYFEELLDKELIYDGMLSDYDPQKVYVEEKEKIAV